MGEVIRFPEDAGQGHGLGFGRGRYIDASSEPATVIILPVIRIERAPDGLEPDEGNNSGRRRRRRLAR
jgi:hypothetical protein